MTAPTRTDIHRPSSPDFDPADYECRGVFDLHPEDGTMAARRHVVAALVAEGIRFGGVHPTGQCDHCGTYIRYEALMVHRPSRTIVTVGETCLDDRFALATRADFKALRAAAAAKSAATREAHRLHATAQAAVEWLGEAHPLLVELSYAGNGGLVDQDMFLEDIARSLYRNGELTGRQEQAVERALTRTMERQARDDERARETAARQSSGVQAPSGRTDVTGTVGAVWTRDGMYGLERKWRVVDDSGYVVIGTIPSSLVPDHPTPLQSLSGRRVSFAAQLTPTDDDATVAWSKRPTKARLI